MKEVLITGSFLVLLFLTSFISAQQTHLQSELFIPVEIQRAYQKQTRSIDGKPGPNYWQNSSEYNINVTLDPVTRLISGEETIIYKNNSPDSLRQLVLRLYQNLNKPESQRDFPLDSNALGNGIIITNLVVGGDTIDPGDRIKLTYRNTILIIDIDDKVYSGESVELQIAWNFVVPNVDHIRMGAYSETDYMIAYWYPQMAVYDDLYGWDKVEHTGQAEFYNDFCDFDVIINVPDGYSVWGTGLLQNPEEVFTEEYFKRYKEAKNSREIIKIIGPEDLSKQVYQHKGGLSWRYKATHVPDFAFAISNRYLWDAVTIKDMSEDNQSVFVSSAYNPVSEDFYEVADISRQTIESMSKEFPGIPFPYPSMTVFNGGGGMEYPMMVNDASSGVRWGTVHLTSHEIAHTYFPFYMGTNETRFAWMDEGWAVMLPAKIQNRLSPDYNPKMRNTSNYLQYAGTYQDIPPMVASYVLNGNMYRTPAYNRSGAAYFILEDMLGEEIFKKSLRDFVNTWNGKHPMPFDFFFSFNKSVGEDLSWFWKPWFFDFGYPDLEVTDAKLEGTKLKFLIQMNGNLPIPVSAKIYLSNGNTVRFYESASVWKNGVKKKWFEVVVPDTVQYISLEDQEIPDIYNTNNFYNFED